mgnify:CR=1 FL=1
MANYITMSFEEFDFDKLLSIIENGFIESTSEEDEDIKDIHENKKFNDDNEELDEQKDKTGDLEEVINEKEEGIDKHKYSIIDINESEEDTDVQQDEDETEDKDLFDNIKKKEEENSDDELFDLHNNENEDETEPEEQVNEHEDETEVNEAYTILNEDTLESEFIFSAQKIFDFEVVFTENELIVTQPFLKPMKFVNKKDYVYFEDPNLTQELIDTWKNTKVKKWTSNDTYTVTYAVLYEPITENRNVIAFNLESKEAILLDELPEDTKEISTIDAINIFAQSKIKKI